METLLDIDVRPRPRQLLAGTRVRYWKRDTGTVLRTRERVKGRPECGTVVDVLFDATNSTEPFVMGVSPDALWLI